MGRVQRSVASTDMVPVTGSVEVQVPVDALWDVFSRPRIWPRWNRCFTWVWNRELRAGDQLVWAFEPIEPRYLYRLPAVATIIAVEPPHRVTWEVTAFPGMHARHTYFLRPLDEHRTCFGSWEQADGPGYRLLRPFWLAHFRFVCREALAGGRRLESLYRRRGSFDPLLSG